MTKSEEKESYWEIYQIYHLTILTKEEEENQFFRNLRKELRKLALFEVNFIKKLTKIDNVTLRLILNLETDDVLKSLFDALSLRIRREGIIELLKKWSS